MIITENATELLSSFFRLAVIILELAGTLTILIGAVFATLTFARASLRTRSVDAFVPFRSTLGRSILLGLEFLVAGDIVKSLVINPTLDDLFVLAGLVLVRTFLSISLGVEINGHWPWDETRMSREQKYRGPGPTGALASCSEDADQSNLKMQLGGSDV